MLNNIDPNCCGSIQERQTLIQRVAQALVQGHQGLALLYESIADQDLKGAPDEQKFRDEAVRHRQLGEQTAQVLVYELSTEKVTT